MSCVSSDCMCSMVELSHALATGLPYHHPRIPSHCEPGTPKVVFIRPLLTTVRRATKQHPVKAPGPPVQHLEEAKSPPDVMTTKPVRATFLHVFLTL